MHILMRRKVMLLSCLNVSMCSSCVMTGEIIVLYHFFFIIRSQLTPKNIFHADTSKHLWHMQVYDSLNIQIHKLYLLCSPDIDFIIICFFFSGTFTLYRHIQPLPLDQTLKKISWLNEDYIWEKMQKTFTTISQDVINKRSETSKLHNSNHLSQRYIWYSATCAQCIFISASFVLNLSIVYPFGCVVTSHIIIIHSIALHSMDGINWLSKFKERNADGWLHKNHPPLRSNVYFRAIFDSFYTQYACPLVRLIW